MILISCQENPTNDNDLLEEAFYFSFEDSSEVEGWLGIWTSSFYEDKDAPCGEHILYVAGGCLQPTARFQGPFQAASGYYRLGAYMKSINGGPTLVFNKTGFPENSISIAANDTAWQYYLSEKALFVNEGDSIDIDIFIGGYFPLFGYIDCLQIFTD